MRHDSKKIKRTTDEKKQAIARFFKRVFFGFVSVIALTLTLYLFVLPSILVGELEPKNILIVSSKLDVASKNIYFAHISDNETKHTVVTIPAEQTVTVPGGYGEYPLQSVYQLLLIDKKDSQFTTSVFSELLGTTIDEVIAIDEPLGDITESQLSGLFFRHATKNAKNFNLGSLKSSLKLHYLSKDISLIDLEKLEDFQQTVQEFVTISGDLYQYCSVAIVNATGENGVARQTGKIIERGGALVVRYDDSTNQQEKTQIYFGSDPIDCSQLARSISGIFRQKPEILPLEKLENAQQYRAKVVVVIGK